MPVATPTKTGSFNVVLQAGAISFTKSVQVRSGAPETITHVSLPNSVVVASGLNVCGTTATLSAYVTDKNGVAVVNGLPSTWTTTVTVTVGTIFRSVTVTFTAITPPSSVASIGGVSFAQSIYDCSGAAYATYRNFGSGSYFRPQQGCTLYVQGTAYTSTGALAKNAVVTVTVSVDGALLPTTTTVTTDDTGRFIATPYVPIGSGLRSFSYTVWDYNWGIYRRITDYWAWGNLSISSSSGQSLFTTRLYAVKKTS